MTRDALPMDDPEVRKLAIRNHYPEEEWICARTMERQLDGRLDRLSCAKCFQDWPCATREALVAWYRNNPPEVG